MALIVNRDERILLADPGYPCNRTFIRLLEGAPVGVPVGADTRYQLTANLIERNWTSMTRGVLIASPANPTGTTVERDEMQRIDATVRRLGGRLIVDEIYLGLTYGAPPRSVLDFAGDAFVVSSFSKYFNMTGWRLGWLVAPSEHVRDLEKLAQNLYISPSTPSQRAALGCFEPETLEIVEQRREAFEARRDFLVPALRELGFGVPVTPTGGFFVYADCSRFADDSEAFCRDVLEGAAVAFTPGMPVAVFSMEMGASQLAMRLIGSVGRLDQHKLRTGRLQPDDWDKLSGALGRLNEAPILIDETPALNAIEVRSRARRLMKQYGKLGLVIVDYLQLMQASTQGENRATEISEISRAMKSLAKELQVPVVALSQLNRSLEQRPNKRPVMSDLRESGAIEQDADVILFIYRDEVYNAETQEKGVAEIIISKQRNGPIGTVFLTFLGEFTRFENRAAPGSY